MQLGVADHLLQVRNDGFRNHRPALAKVNHAAHAARRLHLAQGILPVKTREKIIGEQRLGHPAQTLPRGALETHARQKNFDALHFFEVRRRDVFMLRPGTEAEPIPKIVHKIAGGFFRR